MHFFFYRKLNFVVNHLYNEIEMISKDTCTTIKICEFPVNLYFLVQSMHYNAYPS